MTVIRVVVGVISVALMIAFNFGLRSLMFGMGREFSLGVVFGIFLLLSLQWIYYRLSGKTIFDPD